MQESLEGSAPDYDDLDPLVQNSPVIQAGRKRELDLIDALQRGDTLPDKEYRAAQEHHACRTVMNTRQACWMLTANEQTCDSKTCPVKAMRAKRDAELRKKDHEFVTDWYMSPEPDKQVSTE